MAWLVWAPRFKKIQGLEVWGFLIAYIWSTGSKKRRRKKSHSALIWPGSSLLANQSLMRMPLALLYLPMLPLRSPAFCLCREHFRAAAPRCRMRAEMEASRPEKLIKFRSLAFQVTGTRGGKPHPPHKRDPHELWLTVPGGGGWASVCPTASS